MKALYILIVSLLFIACKKELSTKPEKSLFIPDNLTDLQALMDNRGIFSTNMPGLGELGSDDHYIQANDLFSRWAVERNAYVWQKDVFEGELYISDWEYPYQQIFYSNTVLEAIEKIPATASNSEAWKNVKGSAHFCRAFAFYGLAQVFTKPYDAATASTDLGLPLRLTSDINVAIGRSSVKQTYEQIITDLRTAAGLLPVNPLGKTRPSKPAAYALLARTYLIMEDYDNAFLYADSCLQLYNNLIDYNSLDTIARYPFPSFSTNNNSEIIYHGVMINYTSLTSYSIVDSILYASYDSDDLRKPVFFMKQNGTVKLKGSYAGSVILFVGLATDEVFLIRAECNARKNNTTAAIDDLNTLMVKRWVEGNFTPFAASNADEALDIILTERRKELLTRGLRWTDLRRLNKYPRYAKTLTRVVDGVTYTLPPGDNRYVYPIPNHEMLYNDIPQNPR